MNVSQTLTYLAWKPLPAEVLEPANQLGGMYLWLINGLAAICLVAAGGMLWYERAFDEQIGATRWMMKILFAVAIAAGASNIGAAVIVV